MVDPVEDDRPDRDLPDIRLAARLGGYQPREQREIPALCALALLPGRQAEGRQRRGAEPADGGSYIPSAARVLSPA